MRMKNEELGMRSFGKQCVCIVFDAIEALQSNANNNYSLFTIDYSLATKGGI